MKLQDIINSNLVLSRSLLMGNTELLREIHSLLSKLNWYPPHAIDGLPGPITDAALKAFCASQQLNNMQTGEFGATFAKALLDASSCAQSYPRQVADTSCASKYLTHADYKDAADLLHVTVAHIKAVLDVETEGSGFLKDGRPKILFEAFHFDRITNGKFRQQYPSLSAPRWDRRLYKGGAREYDRLNTAVALNKSAAYMATSWGLGQVMGFNYKMSGYRDVETFVKDMHASEGKQLMAMCAFIKYNKLDDDLRVLNWESFAKGYNGAGFRANAYHLKLAKAYKEHSA